MTVGAAVPQDDLPDDSSPTGSATGSAAPAAPGAAPVPLADLPDDQAAQAFQQAYGRAPEGAAELKNFVQHPELAPGAPARGPGISAIGETALAQGTGLAASVPAAATMGGQLLAGDVAAPFASKPAQFMEQNLESARQHAADVQRFLTYQPRAAESQQLNQQVGGVISDAISDVGQQFFPGISPQTQQDILTVAPLAGIPEAAEFGVGLARGAVGVAKAGARAVAEGVNPQIPAGTEFTPEGVAKPPASATTPMAGSSPRRAWEPVTGDTLKAAPNPIPRPNEAPAQPAGQPGSISAAATGAPMPRERTFAAPSEDGPQPTPTPEQQGWRKQQLDDLNQITDRPLEGRRLGAETGDYATTATEWSRTKLPGPSGALMRAQVAAENGALHGAMDQLYGQVGSSTEDSVDPEVNEQRAQVVRPALAGIQGYIKSATDGMYDGARRTVGQNPIPSPGVGPDGTPLHPLANTAAFLKDDGNFTTGDAGAFRRAASAKLANLWQNGDKLTNTPPASIGAAERFREYLNSQPGQLWHVVKPMREALDSDVAKAGGPQTFQAARNLRIHQQQLLDSNPIISKALDRDTPTPDRDLMDQITNAPREQFTHLINTLRAGAKLDPSLAEGSAAAIREIRSHMIARMHASATNADATWNPRNFHLRAAAYASKLPAVFRPDEISDLQTVNRGGNVLKMDKSYHGAYAQQLELTEGVLRGVRERAGVAARGLVDVGAHHVAPIAGPVVAEMTGIPGKIQRAVGGPSTEERLEAARLEDVRSRIVPMGQRLPKQGGWIGDLRKEKLPPVGEIQADQQGGRRLKVFSANGVTEAARRGNDTQLYHTETAKSAQGSGEAVARAAALADDAHGRGGNLTSDTQVSKSGQKVYPALSQLGYDVKQNPNVERDAAGTLRSTDTRPVFTVGPGKFQRGAVGDLGTKQAEPDARLNVGLHVGDPNAGGRVMTPEEVTSAIKATGHNVGKISVVSSNTEPTLVADLDKAMTPDKLHQLSAKLQQGAIAQRYNDGSGILEGPQAKDWGGEYNPDYFRMHDGRTATEAARPPQTVKNPQRNAFPGIYDDPKAILSRLKVAPEDPIMKQLFGVTRKDLHDVAMSREGPLPGKLPKEAANPKGSVAAKNVMTPENADRLVNLLNEAKKNPELAHGMVGWYVMDALHQKAVDLLGRKGGTAAYSRLNTLMGMASPGSDVLAEIARGTAAHMMETQDKFNQFLKQGGRPAGAPGKPKLLANVPGHPYHSTAQGRPMGAYLKSGEVHMGSPKVPTYIQASGTPETGFQTSTPVGDSHWSRGVGLSDTRTSKEVTGSVTTPEMTQLRDWYAKNVARRAGLTPVSAQALQWGALGGETGVKTPVGAPKLELFAQQVRKAAARLGKTPEETLELIIRGMAHAG